MTAEEQALEVLIKVCDAFQTTGANFKVIVQALNTLSDALIELESYRQEPYE